MTLAMEANDCSGVSRQKASSVIQGVSLVIRVVTNLGKEFLKMRDGARAALLALDLRA